MAAGRVGLGRLAGGRGAGAMKVRGCRWAGMCQVVGTFIKPKRKEKLEKSLRAMRGIGLGQWTLWTRRR